MTEKPTEGMPWMHGALPRDLEAEAKLAEYWLRAVKKHPIAVAAIAASAEMVLEFENRIDNMRSNRRMSEEWVKLEDLVDDFREKFG